MKPSNDPRLVRAFLPSEHSEPGALVPTDDPVELMRRHMGAQPLELRRVAPLAPFSDGQATVTPAHSDVVHHAPSYHPHYGGSHPTISPTFQGPQYGAYNPVFKPTTVVHVHTESHQSDRGGYWSLGLVLIFFLPLIAAILAGGLND